MAIRTGGCYPPLVGSGHGPGNGQADAIAFSLAAVGGIPSVKPLKKMGELIPGNIAGGVGDGELYIFSIMFQMNVNISMFRTIFQGVIHKDSNQLSQSFLVAADRRGWISLAGFEHEAVYFQSWPEHGRKKPFRRPYLKRESRSWS